MVIPFLFLLTVKYRGFSESCFMSEVVTLKTRIHPVVSQIYDTPLDTNPQPSESSPGSGELMK